MEHRRGLKLLGVLTSDFAVYYDLVSCLRARGIAFATLSPDEPIPDAVGVVITTAAEAPAIAHPNVVPFRALDETIAAATRLLQAPGPFRTCVIGIDPGERPGVAVLADGRVLQLAHAKGPEAVHEILREVLTGVRAERFIIRVGNGAPTFRDRILATLGGFNATLELVDERRTTPPDYHSAAERDTAAATNIALMPGTIISLSDVRPARPTEGELRDIQRKSRLASQGMVTISRALARHVALGRLSLDDAILRMRQKA